MNDSAREWIGRFLNRLQQQGEIERFNATLDVIEEALNDSSDGKRPNGIMAVLLEHLEDMSTPDVLARLRRVVDANRSDRHTQVLREMEQAAHAMAGQAAKRIDGLRRYLKLVRDPMVPQRLVFGDKHGESAELERIRRAAQRAMVKGLALTVVGLGDTFDRGGENIRNLRILQEMRRWSDACPDFELHLCLGNHDTMLIRAVLLEQPRAMDTWQTIGGAAVVRECKAQQADLRELALWTFLNSTFTYEDPWGLLYVHAGVPVELDGMPAIGREQLHAWNTRLNELQADAISAGITWPTSLKQEIWDLFHATCDLRWLNHRNWLQRLIRAGRPTAHLDIDKEVVPHLLRIIAKHIRRQHPDIPMEEIIVMAKRQSRRQLLRNPKAFRDAGFHFSVLEADAVTDEQYLDRFLGALGIQGLVHGHEHLLKPMNLDRKIFCIDCDEGIPGYMLLNNLGIWFLQAGHKAQCLADSEELEASIQADLRRLTGQG